MLDGHSNKLASGSVDTDFQGFIGLIHSSGSFPLVSQYGFQITPGVNFIHILRADLAYKSFSCSFVYLQAALV